MTFCKPGWLVLGTKTVLQKYNQLVYFLLKIVSLPFSLPPSIPVLFSFALLRVVDVESRVFYSP